MSAIPKTMRAVSFTDYLPIEDPSSLVDVTVDVPTVSGHDLLVRIEAVAVNPADASARSNRQFFEHIATKNKRRILGYDAAGVVVAVGSDVTLFKVGDEVYYSGSFVREGSNAEYQAVDERVVGHKPKSLNFTDAASLPLTANTAYEALFHRLEIPQKTPSKKSVLVINGAGGCGSISIQLLKALTDFTVIATASRPESTAWVKELGADHVVNHAEDIPKQLAAIGFPEVDYILVNTSAPSSVPTDDLIEQHRLLEHVSKLVDAKKIRSTASESLGKINAENLKKAHAAMESRRTIGKLVLTGF
ncbi:hypothetical protein Ae201684P_014033 [Aphanomyces euteiches]|nr:hypothetical protein Ae201684P_014033 [Aphanomyces euteiches]